MKQHGMIALAMIWLMMFHEEPAMAYLDPGTGSMLLQVLLGGVAGAAVVGKLFWQRIVSFLTGKRTN